VSHSSFFNVPGGQTAGGNTSRALQKTLCFLQNPHLTVGATLSKPSKIAVGAKAQLVVTFFELLWNIVKGLES